MLGLVTSEENKKVSPTWLIETCLVGKYMVFHKVILGLRKEIPEQGRNVPRNT